MKYSVGLVYLIFIKRGNLVEKGKGECISCPKVTWHLVHRALPIVPVNLIPQFSLALIPQKSD